MIWTIVLGLASKSYIAGANWLWLKEAKNNNNNKKRILAVVIEDTFTNLYIDVFFEFEYSQTLILLHSERPKLYTIVAFLSAVGLRGHPRWLLKTGGPSIQNYLHVPYLLLVLERPGKGQLKTDPLIE